MTASPSHRDVMRDGFWIDVASRSDADLVTHHCRRCRIILVGCICRHRARLSNWSCSATVRFFLTPSRSTTHGQSTGTTSRVAYSLYLFSILPAEIYVELTKDAHGAIVLYGLLHFAAPLLGLLATWAADRSKDHIIFVYACLSTALLGPLVFGFPTEMWIAHALFWPALAFCHYGRDGIGSSVLLFTVLLALAFTHEGALVFVAAIVTTLLIRQRNSASVSEMHRRCTRCRCRFGCW